MSFTEWTANLPKFAENVYFGNPLWLSFSAIVSSILCYLFLRFMRHFLLSLLEKQDLPEAWKTSLTQVIKRTKPYFLLGVSLFAGLHLLDLSARADKILVNTFKFVCFLQAALWIDRGIMLLIRQTFVSRAQGDPMVRAETELNSPRTVIITFMARLLIVATFVLMFLDNLGVNITALVTGLGVGGVAVALAVQNILGDLFASLAIALDKPFEIGDVICIAPHTGTVEKVGLKTTRILLTSGEQLVVGNQEILRNRIQNFKRMQLRRVTFPLFVSVNAKSDDIEQLLEEGRIIISSLPDLRLDRAWVKGFSSGGLQLEWVYTILNPGFEDYAHAQQKLTLGLLKACQRLSIRVVTSENSSQET